MKKLLKIVASILFPPFAIYWLYKVKGAKVTGGVFAAIIAIAMLTPNSDTKTKTVQVPKMTDEEIIDSLNSYQSYKQSTIPEVLNKLATYYNNVEMGKAQTEWETEGEMRTRLKDTKVKSSDYADLKFKLTFEQCKDQYYSRNGKLIGNYYDLEDKAFKFGWEITDFTYQGKEINVFVRNRHIKEPVEKVKNFFNGKDCVKATAYAQMVEHDAGSASLSTGIFKNPSIKINIDAIEANGIMVGL